MDGDSKGEVEETEAEEDDTQRVCIYCVESKPHPRFACLLAVTTAHGTYSARHVSSRIMTSRHPLKLLRRLNSRAHPTATAAAIAQDESDTDQAPEEEDEEGTQQRHSTAPVEVNERPQKKQKTDTAKQQHTGPKKAHWKLVCFVGPFSKGSSVSFESRWKQEARKDIGRLTWAVINADCHRGDSGRRQRLDVFIDMQYRELLAKQLAKTASGRSFIQKYTEIDSRETRDGKSEDE